MNIESLYTHFLQSTGVSTDTRKIGQGNIFFALKGPNFNANDFAPKALEAGASLVVVDEQRVIPEGDPRYFLVEDALLALQKLANHHRHQLHIPIIGLTGSNGKTTSKELLHAVLKQKFKTSATVGNLNNHIGVPLTLLRLTSEHRYGVFELGANHLGEIAYTAGLVRPQAAVIVNVGTAHLEGFGSREGIATAKGEIYDGLADGGTAVINADDDFAGRWLAQCRGLGVRVLTFSAQGGDADIRATDIRCGDMPLYAFTLHVAGQALPVQLQLLGRHQVMNALAAAALAHASGITPARIRDGLQRTRPFAGRSVPHDLGAGRYVIDDTYNANPSAMKAAIDLLASLPGRRVLVLGDMGELGDAAASGHFEVGEYAKMKKIDALYATGRHAGQYDLGFDGQAQLFPDHQALLKALEAELQGVVTILVKGSRSARMEQVVQGLTGSQGGH